MKQNWLYVDNIEAGWWVWSNILFSLLLCKLYVFCIKGCFVLFWYILWPFDLLGLIFLVSFHIKISSKINPALPPSCSHLLSGLAFSSVQSFEIALVKEAKGIPVLSPIVAFLSPLFLDISVAFHTVELSLFLGTLSSLDFWETTLS